MIAIIVIVVWGIIGWLYSRADFYDGIDKDKLKKLNLRAILDLLVILPIFISLFSYAYLSTIIAITFNWYKMTEPDFIRVFFGFVPNKLKKRFLHNVINQDIKGYAGQKFYIIDYLEKTPAKLQSIIVDWHIDNNRRFDAHKFKEIKDNYLQWKYIDCTSKYRQLTVWESDWLKQYIADERDRKIDSILND